MFHMSMSRLVMPAVVGALALAGSSFGVSPHFVSSAAACPSFAGAPLSGSLALDEGFLPDPVVRNVTAGGTQNVGNCGLPSGWVSTQPDLRLQYDSTGASPLSFVVQSNLDTILVINDPMGNWHFDDDSGDNLNAVLRFPNASSGQWDIWVGTYDTGVAGPAQVQITELR